METSRGRSSAQKPGWCRLFLQKSALLSLAQPSLPPLPLERGRWKSCWPVSSRPLSPAMGAESSRAPDSSSWHEHSLPPRPTPVSSRSIKRTVTSLGRGKISLWVQMLDWQRRCLALPTPWMSLQRSHCALAWFTQHCHYICHFTPPS